MWKVNTQIVQMQANPPGEKGCGQVTSGHLLRIRKAQKAPPRMIEKKHSEVTVWLSTKPSLLSLAAPGLPHICLKVVLCLPPRGHHSH